MQKLFEPGQSADRFALFSLFEHPQKPATAVESAAPPLRNHYMRPVKVKPCRFDYVRKGFMPDAAPRVGKGLPQKSSVFVTLRKLEDLLGPKNGFFARYGVKPLKIKAEPGASKLGSPGKVVMRKDYRAAKLPEVENFRPFPKLQTILDLDRHIFFLERFEIDR